MKRVIFNAGVTHLSKVDAISCINNTVIQINWDINTSNYECSQCAVCVSVR